MAPSTAYTYMSTRPRTRVGTLEGDGSRMAARAGVSAARVSGDTTTRQPGVDGPPASVMGEEAAAAAAARAARRRRRMASRKTRARATK